MKNQKNKRRNKSRRRALVCVFLFTLSWEVRTICDDGMTRDENSDRITSKLSFYLATLHQRHTHHSPASNYRSQAAGTAKQMLSFGGKRRNQPEWILEMCGAKREMTGANQRPSGYGTTVTVTERNQSVKEILFLRPPSLSHTRN